MKRTLLLFVLLSLCRMAVAQGPVVSFAVSHYHTCDTVVNLLFRDGSYSPSGSTIVFRKWEFGDGAVDSSGQNVNHTYTRSGVYSVRLTVRDAQGRTSTGVSRWDETIMIGTGVKLTATSYLCNNTTYPVTIYNQAAHYQYDSLGTYAWYNRNDQLVSTNRMLETVDSGRYTLQYSACNTTLFATTTVLRANGKPVIAPGAYVWAYDTATVLFGVQNMPFSTGYNKVTWRWGDGQYQSAPSAINTAHNYLEPGTYNVAFEVSLQNGGACDTTGYYNLVLRQPHVTHNAWNGKDSVMEGGMYEINAGNEGATYEWGSSDPGFHANTQSIVIEEQGKFWVKISKDGDVIVDTINFRYPPIPWMELTSHYISTCSDTAVVVANVHNRPAGYTVAWNNGVVSDSIYVDKPGPYSALLKDQIGSVVDADTINISVKESLHAKIELHRSPDPGNDTLIAYPHAQSPEVYFYKWYRNGIEVASGNYPMLHDLTPGTYNVSVLSNAGCSDFSDSIYYQSAGAWTLDARIGGRTPCGDSVLLIASANTPDSNYIITWSTGQQSPSIYITKYGRYIATLKDLKGNIYAMDTVLAAPNPLVVRLEVHPSAIPGNDTLIAYPNKQSSGDFYRWYRNDIEVTSDNSAMLHSPVTGTYKVSLLSNGGCSALSDSIHYESSGGWLLNAHVGGTTPCGDSALLTASVNLPDSDYTVTWNTGQQSSSFYVTTSGQYIATLKDLQGNIQAVDSVEVDLKPLTGRLEMHPSTTPDNDTLIAFPNVYGYHYRWLRNGLMFRGGPDPITNYPVPGVYQVTITTDRGCVLTTDTLHYKMDGTGLPVDFTAEISSCDAQTVNFVGNVNIEDPNIIYTWDLADQTYLEFPFATMSHRFEPGTYQITLMVTTSSGSAGSVTKQVVVHADQEIWTGKIIKQSNQCGDTVWLTASSTNPKTSYFTWSTGEQASTIAVTRSGRYGLDVHDSCYAIRAVDTVDVIINAPCLPADTISIGDGPIEGGKVLPVTAGFDHGFNADNVFTVQLTLQDPGGRETGIRPDEVINLGSIPGTTKDIAMQVDIPDTLACATSYAVRVVASSPADTTAWSQLFTIANQPPQPTITQRGDSLFTSGKYNWQWCFNDKAIEGATAANYRARANGSYTVESLNGNGCKSKSAPVSVIITAVGEVTLGGNKVKAFPNPSEGQVSLQFEKPLLKTVTIKVYNMNGRVMYTRTTTQQQQPLDLSGLPKGYYLIELTGYGQQKVLSLILQ